MTLSAGLLGSTAPPTCGISRMSHCGNTAVQRCSCNFQSGPKGLNWLVGLPINFQRGYRAPQLAIQETQDFLAHQRAGRGANRHHVVGRNVHGLPRVILLFVKSAGTIEWNGFKTPGVLLFPNCTCGVAAADKCRCHPFQESSNPPASQNSGIARGLQRLRPLPSKKRSSPSLTTHASHRFVRRHPVWSLSFRRDISRGSWDRPRAIQPSRFASVEEPGVKRPAGGCATGRGEFLDPDVVRASM